MSSPVRERAGRNETMEGENTNVKPMQTSVHKVTVTQTWNICLSLLPLFHQHGAGVKPVLPQFFLRTSPHFHWSENQNDV